MCSGITHQICVIRQDFICHAWILVNEQFTGPLFLFGIGDCISGMISDVGVYSVMMLAVLGFGNQDLMLLG